MNYPGSAILSPCERYRYTLVRVVRPDVVDMGSVWKRLLYIGANPSTATADAPDNTVRRAVGFTLSFNIFSSFEIVNPLALRTPEPDDVMDALAGGEDVVGPENDEHILAAARRAALVICAWGSALRTKHPVVRKRLEHVIALLHQHHRKLYQLGDGTNDGQPRHLLMLKGGLEPRLWREAA